MNLSGLRATTEPGITIIVAAIFCAFACVLPKQSERLSRAAERLFCKLAMRKRLAVLLLFLAVIVVRLLLLPLLPVPNPGIADEFSYLLMSDTFARGRLANPPHPMWQSFETFHLIWLPTYASKYPPAQGAMLALGQVLGHPWIGVLLSAAAMCALAVWALQAWMPPRWALLAGVLAAGKLCGACYWINSYWGGAVAGAAGALVVGALGRLLRRASVANAILLAIGVAILLNSRPYEAIFFCIPLTVAFFRWLLRKKEGAEAPVRRWRLVFVPAAAVLLATVVWMGYYNWRVTGSPLVTPYALCLRTYDRSALFIWQLPKPSQPYSSVELDAMYNKFERFHYRRTWEDLKAVSREKLVHCNATFAWPALFFVLPALLFVDRDKRVRLLALALLATLAAFLVTTWSFPHYIAPATCLIFGMVAQGIRHLRTMRIFKRPIGAALSRALVLALIVDVTLLAGHRVNDTLGWGGWGLSDRADIQRKLEAKPGKHLVMVHYVGHHSIHQEWVYNGAEIDNSKVLWARDLDAKQNAKLFRYFKDREIWLVEPGEDSTPLRKYHVSKSQQIPEF
jgi:hypothetical protein